MRYKVGELSHASSSSTPKPNPIDITDAEQLEDVHPGQEILYLGEYHMEWDEVCHVSFPALLLRFVLM